MTATFMLWRPPGTRSLMQGMLLNSIALRQARTAAFCTGGGGVGGPLRNQLRGGNRRALLRGPRGGGA